MRALLISLAKIPGLGALEEQEGCLVIGAGVKIAGLESSARVRALFPAISAAAASIAGPAHRLMATVGGNLCLDTRCVYFNQSEWWRAANHYCLKKDGDSCHVQKKGNACVAAYSGDLAPALLVLGAEVEIETAGGRLRRPLAGLFRDDGKDHLELEPADLLVAVRVPLQPRLLSGYLKSRVRRSMDFPLAGVAAAMACERDVITRLAVAITGTDSRPVLLEGLDSLAGKPLDAGVLDGLAKNLAHSIQPMRTTIVSSHYRRHIAGVLTRRLVSQLYAGRDGAPGQ